MMGRTPYDVPEGEPLRNPHLGRVIADADDDPPGVPRQEPRGVMPQQRGPQGQQMRMPEPQRPPVQQQPRPPQPMPAPPPQQRPPQQQPMPQPQQRAPQPQVLRNDGYRSLSVGIGTSVLLLLLLGVLFLDGVFTVLAATGIGWSPAVGIAAHLTIVILQLFVWKVPSEARRYPELANHIPAVTTICYTISVLAGTVNTLTSAMGLSALFKVVPFTLDWALPMTGLAEMMAMVPEPVVVVCVVILWSMHKRLERDRR